MGREGGGRMPPEWVSMPTLLSLGGHRPGSAFVTGSARCGQDFSRGIAIAQNRVIGMVHRADWRRRVVRPVWLAAPCRSGRPRRSPVP